MRFLKLITIASMLLLAQLGAFAAQLAVLRNGYSIRFERKEQNGDVTRLYTDSGYMDIASDQIASFEQEEAPVPPQPTVAPQPVAVSQPATVPASQPVPTQNTASLPIAKIAAPAKAVTDVDLEQVVREASSKNRLDPDFVNSVIRAESNFKTHAISKKGAQGLMQLMPGTAAQLGVADPFDPKANVEGGAAYLSALLDLYHDDPIKALAAYNAGAHRVQQYNGVPPYRETRAYINQIVRDFNAKKRAQMKATAAPAPKTATKSAAPAKPINAKPAAKKAKTQQTGTTQGS